MLSDLRRAIFGARTSVQDLTARISRLETDLAAIRALPPHIDDVIASFTRGLDAASQSFEARLRWYVNDANVAAPGAADGLATIDGQLLGLPVHKPSFTSLMPPSTLGHGQPMPDLAAIAYFLRPAIEAQNPVLVEKLLPSAKKGLRQAERETRIAKLEAEIANLRAERDAIVSELDATRYASAAQPVVLSPSDLSA